MLRPMMARLALCASILLWACSPSPITGIALAGDVHTDLRQDQPCEEIALRPELSGVALTFGDADGREIGAVRTGALQWTPLPPGPGTEAWTHHGCRFFAAYTAELPITASYTVTFAAPPPAGRGTGTFTGVSDLAAQTATLAELEARSFRWSFEAAPSYVVP
jgi:hypothetical protein